MQFRITPICHIVRCSSHVTEEQSSLEKITLIHWVSIVLSQFLMLLMYFVSCIQELKLVTMFKPEKSQFKKGIASTI